MSKTAHYTFLIVAMGLLLAVPSHAFAQTAVEVMRRYIDQFSVPDETVDAKMTLTNAAGKSRTLSLKIMTKDYPGDLKKALIRFTAPEKIYGTSLLIIENNDRNDDQWLYLPSLKKVKKISTAERSHSFMGSELTYEDLQGEKMRDFNYKLLRSDAIAGKACFVIEAVPASSRKVSETGYGNRIMWMSKDTGFKAKVEYYDKAGALLKTETDEGIAAISGGKYRATKVLIVNAQNGNRTSLTTEARHVGTGLSDSQFTTASLEQGD